MEIMCKLTAGRGTDYTRFFAPENSLAGREHCTAYVSGHEKASLI